GVLRRDATDTVEPLVERFTPQVLHHDVGPPVFGETVVVNLDHVLAAQLGRRARLVLETTPRLRALGVLRFDELHRDVRAERGVRALPDRAHAAAADQLREPILPRYESWRRDVLFHRVTKGSDALRRTPEKPGEISEVMLVIMSVRWS